MCNWFQPLVGCGYQLDGPLGQSLFLFQMPICTSWAHVPDKEQVSKDWRTTIPIHSIRCGEHCITLKFMEG
jgi:hypothetical protein